MLIRPPFRRRSCLLLLAALSLAPSVVRASGLAACALAAFELRMGEQYFEEDLRNGVLKLNDEQLAQIRCDLSNHGITLSRTGASLGNGDYHLVIMNRAQDVYLFDQRSISALSPEILRAVFKHSSPSGGEPVNFAGVIRIEDGKITAISNGSGHYKPGLRALLATIHFFREKGVDLNGTKIEVNLPFSTQPLFLRDGPLKVGIAEFTAIVNHLGPDAGWQDYLLALRSSPNPETSEAAALVSLQLPEPVQGRASVHDILRESKTIVGPQAYSLVGWPIRTLIWYKDFRYHEIVDLLARRAQDANPSISNSAFSFLQQCADSLLTSRNSLQPDELEALLQDIQERLRSRPDLAARLEPFFEKAKRLKF